MKQKTTLRIFLTIFLILITLQASQAQVGIGTTNPASGALLDIDSENKGLMIPRIHLTGTDDTTTISSGATVSLLVFNTNDSTAGPNAVTQGFYYWNGTLWVRLMTGGSFWNIDGNDNVTSGTHFLGTTTNSDLDFKTNNTSRLRIPGNSNQILAMANGTNTAPFYSWSSDTNTGMWRPGDDQLAFSAGEVEFLRLRENTVSELVINEGGANLNTRIETDNEVNMLFVRGSNDRIGIKTNNPQTELHIAGNGNTLRIDELSQANNIHYTTNDPMPVYVDINGNLQLQPSLVQNFMPINLVDFITPNNTITSETGLGISEDIYTANISLKQPSLVQVNYQIRVDITMHDGTQIVDGASRLYRAWVEVNSDENHHIAYDSGSYNSRPSSAGNDANTGYLSGNGYAQLGVGNHTLTIKVLAFGGDLDDIGTFGYRMIFGGDNTDRLTVTIHR